MSKMRLELAEKDFSTILTALEWYIDDREYCAEREGKLDQLTALESLAAARGAERLRQRLQQSRGVSTISSDGPQ